MKEAAAAHFLIHLPHIFCGLSIWPFQRNSFILSCVFCRVWIPTWSLIVSQHALLLSNSPETWLLGWLVSLMHPHIWMCTAGCFDLVSLTNLFRSLNSAWPDTRTGAKWEKKAKSTEKHLESLKMSLKTFQNYQQNLDRLRETRKKETLIQQMNI